jgi:S1-C subfamily serine protease
MKSPGYVVFISGTKKKKNDGESLNGTGFIVDKIGHVVTCWHVVSQADEITVKLPYTEPWKYQVSKKLETEDIVLLESVVPPAIETPNAPLHSDWKRDTKIGDAITVWGYSAPEHYTGPQGFDCTISGFSEKDGRIHTLRGSRSEKIH